MLISNIYTPTTPTYLLVSLANKKAVKEREREKKKEMELEKVQNETTFATWKFCYGKLKDNMLQGTLHGEGRERAGRGSCTVSQGNTRGHMLNLLMASFM